MTPAEMPDRSSPSDTQSTSGATWYHTISFPDGSVTPGMFDMRGVARRVPWPEKIKGARCLDIGTCDGFWAFEMEKRGAAEVMAIDVADADDVDLTWEARSRLSETASGQHGTRAAERFEIARRALGSRVNRVGCSIYNLDPLKHGKFDVVFIGTLLIHLRDPIRALERVREVCGGELVMVECVDAAFDLFAPGAPCARLAPYPGQWWRHNAAGLSRLLRVAGFEVESTSRRFVTPFGPALTMRGSRLRRPLAAAAAAVNRWPALAATPGLVQVIGLATGTYDISIRARPAARKSP